MYTISCIDLTLSGQTISIEIASMVSGVGLNISQLRILFRILRNELGAIFWKNNIN